MMKKILYVVLMIGVMVLGSIINTGCKKNSLTEPETYSITVVYFDPVSGARFDKEYVGVDSTNPVIVSVGEAEGLLGEDLDDRYVKVFGPSGAKVFFTNSGESFVITGGSGTYSAWFLPAGAPYERVENAGTVGYWNKAFEYVLSRDGRTIKKEVVDRVVRRFNDVFQYYNSFVSRDDAKVGYYHKSGADFEIGAADCKGAMGLNNSLGAYVDTLKLEGRPYTIERVLQEEIAEQRLGFSDVAQNGTSYTLITNEDGSVNDKGKMIYIGALFFQIPRLK